MWVARRYGPHQTYTYLSNRGPYGAKSGELYTYFRFFHHAPTATTAVPTPRRVRVVGSGTVTAAWAAVTMTKTCITTRTAIDQQLFGVTVGSCR